MGDVVRFVYPSIGTVGVSSQTVTQMIPQPKISFVYPLSSTPTNIQFSLPTSINQQVIDENQFGTINESLVNSVIFNENMPNGFGVESVSFSEELTITPFSVFNSVFLKDIVPSFSPFSQQPNLFQESFLISIYGGESKIQSQLSM